MADGTVQTVVAKNVRTDLDFSRVRPYVASGTPQKGQAVYPTSAGDTAALAQANAAATARAIGIVVAVADPALATANQAADGDAISVCVFGPVYGFSGMTPGAVMYVSAATAGAIVTPAPSGGFWVWPIGYAEDANTLFVMPGVSAPASV